MDARDGGRTGWCGRENEGPVIRQATSKMRRRRDGLPMLDTILFMWRGWLCFLCSHLSTPPGTVWGSGTSGVSRASSPCGNRHQAGRQVRFNTTCMRMDEAPGMYGNGRCWDLNEPLRTSRVFGEILVHVPQRNLRTAIATKPSHNLLFIVSAQHWATAPCMSRPPTISPKPISFFETRLQSLPIWHRA
jgi:hypothetical protein